MSKFPIHVGRCRCGKSRGHEGLCDGEVEIAPVVSLRSTRSPWHDMRDALVEQFDEEIGNWLARRIGHHIKGKACISHFSVAEVPRIGTFDWARNWSLMKKHTEIRKGGCCGSFDLELHHYKSNRRFVFGFNYGH